MDAVAHDPRSAADVSVCPAERFLENGRLVRTPRRQDDRLMLLEHLVSRLLAPGEAAEERAFTARLAEVTADPVRLRRDLVEAGLVGRRQDGSQYWRERPTIHDDEPGARPSPEDSWL
ncbi:DUF2087 domain-containing protein [Cellulomonas fimi]|uniref:DUF2087 domain-containing protein n=1 Tax=Cellulomonas fimi TaxID=1708 RepID=UPI00030874EB|nr:DUF2087 domain-containing protein [Cellulomonas fimi]NNH07796.1 DUF2087 domain-containing protein [Cellulomonas fimi]VEH34975.1 Uncharacterized protein conserved in bacteria (DUF2087) [Cellulomonas fimi]